MFLSALVKARAISFVRKWALMLSEIRSKLWRGDTTRPAVFNTGPSEYEFDAFCGNMKVFTDSVLFAETLIAPLEEWRPAVSSDLSPYLMLLMDRLFPGHSVYRNTCHAGERWSHAFLVGEAPLSQYDVLVDLTRSCPELPDGIVCLAGTGFSFHGQRKRHWVALEGNLHLTVYLAPRRKIDRFGAGFPLLSAVSLVEAIDSVRGLEGRTGIKWVNDVLVDGAKVAGFLVHTVSMEDTVSLAVLGIGVNVEKAPELPPGLVVTRVASLREFTDDHSVLNPKKILSALLDRLSRNYALLLDGEYVQLLNYYRKRSLVIGRRVRILSDPEDGRQKEIAAGRVEEIGENLEIRLEGVEKPVTKGRLILKD